MSGGIVAQRRLTEARGVNVRAPDTGRPPRVVRAKAPLRISFAGGGTDVPPFSDTEGGVVLSATIDRFAYGSMSPRMDNRVCVESVDFGLSLDFPVSEDPALDGKLDLVKAAIRR